MACLGGALLTTLLEAGGCGACAGAAEGGFGPPGAAPGGLGPPGAGGLDWFLATNVGFTPS